MNWNNETILKFLELYRMKSCIWDPQNDNHKNKQSISDAWNNIKDSLGASCTVQDLKRKKDSLMAAYRLYKTKIKKSELSGGSDIYQPTWFAFKLMDSFLNSIYTCNTIRISEDQDTVVETDTFKTIPPDVELSESEPTKSNQDSCFMNPTPPVRKRPRNLSELKEAKKHMEQAFNFMKHVYQEKQPSNNGDDECTIFGQLIARKIRKLSQERRDVMMVKINQLFVDEHALNSPSSSYSTSTRISSCSTPSPPQYQAAYSPQTQNPTVPKEESLSTNNFSSSISVIIKEETD